MERLRLLRSLEAADAKTVLLVAPAGYGKTTLARQWLRHAGGVWLRIHPASCDVPVLARELAGAIAQVAPIDLRRIESSIRAASIPVEQASAVSRSLLDQVPSPVDGWIVIDDYQVLAPSPPAEELLATLESSGRFRFLFASRERPGWATARRLLYQEILELGPSELALDDGEIAELLPPSRRTAALRRQARGWPAVIALAAYSESENVPTSADALSRSLYDYFADELFERATPAAQDCLTAIALLPPLEPAELADFLQQQDAAALVVSTGLAYRADGRVEVHPLARAFLVTKVRARSDADALARRSIDLALTRGLWDEAFGLIQEFGVDDYLERLIVSSFLPLIETGRATALEAFGTYAAGRVGGLQHYLDLIDAEVARRTGGFDRALELGESAAVVLPDDHPLKAHAYCLAGSAAHLKHQFEEAFDLYTRASQLAARPSDVNDSAWGRCLAALYLEHHRMHDSVRELEAIAAPRPEDRLRIFIARQHLARLTTGLYELRAEGTVASRLWTMTADPWVRTGWGNTYGYSLMLQARYEDAGHVLSIAMNEIDEFGLSFGRPHVESTLASVELGLRHFARCAALIRRVEHYLSETGDSHLQLNVQVLRARLFLAQQRPQDALELVADEFERFPTRAMYGEYLSTRALALAVSGRHFEVPSAVHRARTLTGSVETHVLCAAAEAVAALDSSRAGAAAESLLSTAARLRTWDGVVCAARASPRLAAQLAGIPHHRSELRAVLLRSNDSALAKTIGLVSRSSGPHGVLSAREREVLDLLQLGLKNNEVATTLFISASTVKVHVRHILEKLGARTRAEGSCPLRRDRHGGYWKLLTLGFFLLPLERELGRLGCPVELVGAREHGLERRHDRRVELGLDCLREP